MMMSLKKEMVGLAQQQNNYVYIVRCRDQTLYTGWTNQLEKRIEAHNAGKGAKYTKARRNWQTWSSSRQEALLTR